DAVHTLEKSRRLGPDNAIIVGNLANAVDVLAAVTLVSAWIDTQRLPLAGHEAMEVLEALGRGATRTDVQRRVREHPMVQRALELYRQTAILAPRSPDPYAGESEWLAHADDVEGLRGLLVRLDGVEHLD